MEKAKKKINFNISVKQLKELQEIKSSTGLGISEIIRRTIDDYLLWRKVKPVNKD